MSIAADFQGLYGTPAFPKCVHWSEDNLLAVASGHNVVILDPCNLSGPRMFVGSDDKSSAGLVCKKKLDTLLFWNAWDVASLHGDDSQSVLSLAFRNFTVGCCLADCLGVAQDSLYCQLLNLKDTNHCGPFKPEAKICSLSWSPSGASPANACLLATVDTESEV